MNNIRFMEIAPDEKHELRMDAQSHFGTFEVKDDATLYAKVNKLAHSTFDRSKFAVVGSPKITADGIASGFSDNDYIQVSSGQNINLTKPFKIDFSFKTTAQNIEQYILRTSITYLWIYITSSNKLSVRLGTSAWGTDIINAVYNNISINTDYKLSIEFTGTGYKVSLNDNVFYTNSTTSVIPVADTGFALAKQSGNNYFRGSIDLKQFSITVDGKEIFNGNKEGLDVIKPDDYTVVGSPIITDDGVASGFSSSNYITKAFTQVENNEVVFKIGFNLDNITTGGTPNHTLFELLDTTTSQNTSIVAIRVNNVDKISLSQPSRFGTQWFRDIQPTNYSANALIELKLNRTTQTLSYKYYENDVLHTQGSTASTADWGVASLVQLGYRLESFLGSIDLNAFKVYVDGQLVYQPCLKIPYKEGQNYVKVVDELYRDRIKDLFEQKGYNGYYTIGEDDFTLPSNKWSDVIEHKENGLTVAEQRVDQTLIIRGACEQGVDVNLPMEFFSANSYAVFGVGTTGTNTASKFTPAADGNYIAIGKGKV